MSNDINYDDLWMKGKEVNVYVDTTNAWKNLCINLDSMKIDKILITYQDKQYEVDIEKVIKLLTKKKLTK